MHPSHLCCNVYLRIGKNKLIYRGGSFTQKIETAYSAVSSTNYSTNTLSVSWSSFYVLMSVNQKCNFYGPYIYAPSITKTERKAYLKNRTNIILGLTCHVWRKLNNTGGARIADFGIPSLTLYQCATLTQVYSKLQLSVLFAKFHRYRNLTHH